MPATNYSESVNESSILISLTLLPLKQT